MMTRGNERKAQQVVQQWFTVGGPWGPRFLGHPSVLMGPPHDLLGPQMQDVIREVKRDKRNSTMTRGAR